MNLSSYECAAADSGALSTVGGPGYHLAAYELWQLHFYEGIIVTAFPLC